MKPVHSRLCLRHATVTALLTCVFSGCVAYHPKPLSQDAASRALRPPDLAAVRVEAQSLKHPLLPPISFDERDGLSPDEAAVLAVLANPSLRAVRDRRGMASAQLLQAGLLPNPQLSYSLDVPTGGSTAGTINAYGLGLSWDASQLIARSARVRSAASQRAAVDLDVAWQEWQVAQAAKTAVYRVISLTAQHAVAVGTDRRLADNLGRVRQAAEKGLMSELDVAAAEAASNQAHARVLDLEKQREDRRLTLNRLLGLPPETPVALQKEAELPSHFVSLPTNQLLQDLEQRRLDLVALRRGYESQDATVRAAILAQFPKINLGVNRARDTGNVVTTGFGVSIDLPLFDRNQGRIALEYATRKTLFDEYVNRVFEARSEVATLAANLRALNGQIETAQAAEPGLQRLVEAYRRATNQGQADVLSYYTAWNNLAQQQIEILSLEQQLAETRIALELATGRFRIDEPASGANPHAPNPSSK